MSNPLGSVLKQIRQLKGLSLRQVEQDTEISNAYLSQLETGHASRPSPELLHRLAAYYDFPYAKLMEAAGYLRTSDKEAGLNKLNARLQTALMSAELTEEEEEKVAEFVAFLRTQRKGK